MKYREYKNNNIYGYSKTCFLGFLSGIATLKKVVPEVLEKQPYLLTYRLSQDHLELFFNAVRKAGELAPCNKLI